MQLMDKLQICLLAIASRFPYHVVDINEDVLGEQSFEATGWTSLGIIEQLERTAPQLLQAKALLIVSQQKSEIYLVGHSKHVPALMVHCRGRLPASKSAL